MKLRDRIPTDTYKNTVRHVLLLLAFLLVGQYVFQG